MWDGELSGETDIDERGRVVIPREFREKLKLRPAQKLRVEARDHELILRTAISPEDFIKEMKGCVSRSKVKPEELKEIWGVAHSHH